MKKLGEPEIIGDPYGYCHQHDLRARRPRRDSPPAVPTATKQPTSPLTQMPRAHRCIGVPESVPPGSKLFFICFLVADGPKSIHRRSVYTENTISRIQQFVSMGMHKVEGSEASFSESPWCRWNGAWLVTCRCYGVALALLWRWLRLLAQSCAALALSGAALALRRPLFAAPACSEVALALFYKLLWHFPIAALTLLWCCSGAGLALVCCCSGAAMALSAAALALPCHRLGFDVARLWSV